MFLRFLPSMLLQNFSTVNRYSEFVFLPKKSLYLLKFCRRKSQKKKNVFGVNISLHFVILSKNVCYQTFNLQKRVKLYKKAKLKMIDVLLTCFGDKNFKSDFGSPDLSIISRSRRKFLRICQNQTRRFFPFLSLEIKAFVNKLRVFLKAMQI